MKLNQYEFCTHTLDSYPSLLDEFKNLTTLEEYDQYCHILTKAVIQILEHAQEARIREKQLQENIAFAEEAVLQADRQINNLLREDGFDMEVVIALQIRFDIAKAQIASALTEYVEKQELVAKYDLALKKIKVTFLQAKGKCFALGILKNESSFKNMAESILASLVLDPIRTTDFDVAKIYRDNAKDAIKKRIAELK